MQSCSNVAIKEVVGQILNMYNNNILEDNGNELFENWCENGEVFSGLEYEDECIKIMEEISPYVDELTSVLDSFIS